MKCHEAEIYVPQMLHKHYYQLAPVHVIFLNWKSCKFVIVAAFAAAAIAVVIDVVVVIVKDDSFSLRNWLQNAVSANSCVLEK